MDSWFISAALLSIWNAWNIRGFIILSLCLQLVLATTAPLRKKTSNGFVIFLVWSAYLLADWAALFAFGQISNAARQLNSNKEEVAPDVMAFWAAFLLIHLGGPDSITAFSLEDNALWLRHLMGLIIKLFVFLYIFMKTLPHDKFLVPTTLIFVTGVIKYGERSRALYLASLENLKKSIKETTNILSAETEEVSFKSLHGVSQGLIVDIAPDLSECDEFRRSRFTQTPGSAIKAMSLELCLLYEVLYTKIIAAKSDWGELSRAITFFISLVAFILFWRSDKKKFDGIDIAITYALLGGVFIIHLSNVFMLYTSYLGELFSCKKVILRVFGQGFFPFLLFYALDRAAMFMVRGTAIERFLNRDWSEKMGSFNLLSHCFKQGATTQCQKPGFIWNKLAEIRHTSREDWDPELFSFVFENLKSKTDDRILDKERIRKVYEARGDWALEEGGCGGLKPYIQGFQYDTTLLIWHVATEICYNLEGGIGGEDNKMKRLSKVLSDYMMYLLVKQPKLMSPVAGIAHIRYKHTCVQAKLLRRKFSVPNMHAFCEKILEEPSDITEPTKKGPPHVHSVLKDSCRLVRQMRATNIGWEVIFNVWMEMLLYAAGHCRADSHPRMLSEGGEFITFVWIFMAYSGIRAEFPIN